MMRNIRAFLVGLGLLCGAASCYAAPEPTVPSLVQEANVAFKDKDYARARDCYSRAEKLVIRTSPLSFFRARLLMNIATAKVYLKDKPGALVDFEAALAVYSEVVSKMKILTADEQREWLLCAERVATIAESIGQTEKAEAVRSKHAHAASRLLSGGTSSPGTKTVGAAEDADEETDSEDDFVETIQATSNNSELAARVKLARTQKDKKEYAAAGYTWRKIAEQYPDYPYARLNYGCMLAALGRFHEAAEQFELQISLNPKDPKPYRYLLSALRGAGESAKYLDARRRFESSEAFPVYQAEQGETPSAPKTDTPTEQFETLDDIRARRIYAWPAQLMPLRFYVDEVAATKASEKLGFEVIPMIESAFAHWANETGGVVRFQRIYEPEQANIKCTFTDSQTGMHTPFAVGQTSRTAARAEIRLLTSPQGSAKGSSSFYHTTLHEIGHAIGLKHSGSIEDVMYPTLVVPLSCLSHNDRARASALYASY